MAGIIEVSDLCKTYGSGFEALKHVNLSIAEGEIFALLGPNGAGKTTLIGIVCGLIRLTSGRVTIAGFDHARDYRQARSQVGLVPQELSTSYFETVWNNVAFSRGLFGLGPDAAHVEKVLRDLSLWDKRDSRIMTLSGGMKRRVLIAKALAHRPRILFLDEPTAGVDVELRRDMWSHVRKLRDEGVTVILTTHYIDEAEEMADRVGVINRGEIILVENKDELMRKLGGREMTLHLHDPITKVPRSLARHRLRLSDTGSELRFTFDAEAERSGIADLMGDLANAGIRLKDIHTKQSSLEDIFVSLVRQKS